MFQRFLSDNRIFGAIICVLVFIVGSLLYLQSVKRESRRNVQHPQEIVQQKQTPTTEGQPASGGGHFHADGTWHAQPHGARQIEMSVSDENAMPVAWSPVAWSNPLMPDVIPEHLKMPLHWVNWDYMTLVEEKDPGAYAELEQRLRTLAETIIENYNPKRPIGEVWPALIEAEKKYHANSKHSKKYPLPVLGGFRADWYYQEIWNFPEVYKLILSEEPSTQWMDVYHIEMGKLDPNFNLFRLHDGRDFRVHPDNHYKFYTNYNENTGDYSNIYSFSLANSNTAETIHVYPDIMSDAELEQLQGWNYNFNPYTRNPISR